MRCCYLKYIQGQLSLLAGTVQARINHNVLETGVARDPLCVSFHWGFGTSAVQPIRRAGNQLCRPRFEARLGVLGTERDYVTDKQVLWACLDYTGAIEMDTAA